MTSGNWDLNFQCNLLSDFLQVNAFFLLFCILDFWLEKFQASQLAIDRLSGYMPVQYSAVLLELGMRLRVT